MAIYYHMVWNTYIQIQYICMFQKQAQYASNVISRQFSDCLKSYLIQCKYIKKK